MAATVARSLPRLPLTGGPGLPIQRRAPDAAAACIVERQAPGDHVVENVGAVPTLRVGLGLSFLRFHAPEGDKVAGRLAWTESLAVDFRLPTRLTGEGHE